MLVNDFGIYLGFYSFDIVNIGFMFLIGYSLRDSWPDLTISLQVASAKG